MLILDVSGWNVWAWGLVVFQLMPIALIPFVLGRPRQPYGWDTWLASVLGLLLVLLALNACRVQARG